MKYAKTLCAYLKRKGSTHPGKLVLRAMLPVLGIFFLIAITLWCAESFIAEGYKEVKSYDELFVNQQIKRIQHGARGDIVIFGDSSGLMGIDPRILEKELGRTVQNFCTLAYAGPESYATMLEEYLKHNPKPELIILAFHPIQLERDKQWDVWPKIIKESFTTSSGEISLNKKIGNFLDTVIYGSMLYIPLNGRYGGYYGSPKAVENAMDQDHGSLIDPNVLFPRPSTPGPVRTEYKGMTETYRASLEILKNVVEKHGLDTLVLLRTPLPEHFLYDRARIDEAYQEVGTTLAVKKNKLLLDDLSSLPSHYFSSSTHLNRYGKKEFSRMLASKLKPILETASHLTVKSIRSH